MTVNPRIPLVLALGLSLAAPGVASIIYGNPNCKIVLDSGGSVEIGAVTGYTCPGSETDDVDATLTTSAPLSTTLSEDTWCDLYIEVKWNGETTFDDVQVSGFTSFVTDSSETQRTIRLYPGTQTAVLE